MVNLESPIRNPENLPKKLDKRKAVHLMAEPSSLEALKLVSI